MNPSIGRKAIFLTIPLMLVAPVIFGLTGSRSTVEGSHVEILRDQCASDAYAFVQERHGPLIRMQTLELEGDRFDEVCGTIAPLIPGWQSIAYLKKERDALKIERGRRFEASVFRREEITVTESNVDGKTFVEVTEYVPLPWKDAMRARISGFSKPIDEPRFLKGDSTFWSQR